MIDRILIALDGSHRAELVVPYAAYVGAMLGTRMELVTVTDKPGQQQSDLDDSIQRSLAESEGFLSTWMKSIDTSIIDGDPATALTEHAGGPSTLIAMATHGRTGLMRRVAGSVAEAVMRRTDSPVLLIRADNDASNIRVPARISSLLVPLDKTEVAAEALPLAKLAAGKFNSKVTLLYCGDIKDAAEYLDSAAAQFEGLKTPPLIEARLGDPGEQIVKASRDLPHCLIMMCSQKSHVKTGPIRGSVTDYVVRHASAPVLVLPYSGD